MTIPNQPKHKPSFVHGLLSLIVPGLGQFVAGAPTRGLTILVSTATLLGLSVWTVAQRPRFPDYGLSFGVFAKLVVETALLLLFLLALRHILTRFILRDPVVEGFSGYGVAILFILALVFTAQPILATAASTTELANVHTATALFSAGVLAALWLWQVGDAARLGGIPKGMPAPSMGLALFLICVVVFVLGYNITDIDLGKAITEYRDTAILLPRMLWPWKEAFEYDQEVVEETQAIQAPCPDGAVGPPSNEPEANEPWISATPTCGEMSVRDLTGGFTPGTLLTITGGNFTPGMTVRILWKNPIGNAFTPRGVGVTDIAIDANGGFATTLNIPDVVVPESTSVGEQLHTLVVRQESEEVFSGRLSDTMSLALVAMLETIMIGLMATFFGIIFAFPVAFLAAKNLMASIVSPLEQVVGSLLGLVAGFWSAAWLVAQATGAFGGLEKAPIPIFAIAIVAFLALGVIGLRLGAWLSGAILRTVGGETSYWISAGLLSLLAAFPGYLLGLGFSRGIRAIVLGNEVAAVDERLYAYLGAVLLAAAILAFGIRNRATRGISIGLILYTITRTLLNIIRSIEPLIWAIVASVWVGLGPFAGTIALTLHTIASLAKLYSEAIESIDPGPLEAIEATGATRLQTIVYAVIPQILPPYISFTIYRWDINIRMSTIIGLVGGGGIGFLLIQWIRLYDYEAAGIAIWLITITVATLDYVSSAIRERFV